MSVCVYASEMRHFWELPHTQTVICCPGSQYKPGDIGFALIGHSVTVLRLASPATSAFTGIWGCTSGLILFGNSKTSHSIVRSSGA